MKGLFIYKNFMFVLLDSICMKFTKQIVLWNFKYISQLVEFVRVFV